MKASYTNPNGRQDHTAGMHHVVYARGGTVVIEVYGRRLTYRGVAEHDMPQEGDMLDKAPKSKSYSVSFMWSPWDGVEDD